MGKKSGKADVDTMSKAELEKLLGKHGNRKFAPTPMNHCEHDSRALGCCCCGAAAPLQQRTAVTC